MKGQKIGFVSYYKGEYALHALERKEPLNTASSADFGAPGPIIDFQAPLQHTLVPTNQRRKKAFEKMFLEGRPPVNVGVTNNGDVFGGTQISFGDVLGDKQVNVFAASIAQYRTMSVGYVNLGRRFQYALQGYSQTQFFYGQYSGLFYDPSLAPLVSRDLALEFLQQDSAGLGEADGIRAAVVQGDPAFGRGTGEDLRQLLAQQRERAPVDRETRLAVLVLDREIVSEREQVLPEHVAHW